MKIAIRIAAAADRSYTRFPCPHAKVDECLNADGKLDRVKAQMAFRVDDTAEYRPFTASSKDDDAVYWAALTWFDCLSEAMNDAAENPTIDVHRGVMSAADRRLERKMDNDRYVIVRQTINRVNKGVNVRVGVDNPHEVVGQSEQEAWAFAMLAVQVWLRIMERCKWLTVECERPGLIEEAKEECRRSNLRKRHAACPNRRCEYCSPSKMECELFRAGGKCGYGELFK